MPRIPDLFTPDKPKHDVEELGLGAWLLRGFARGDELERELLSAIREVASAAPFRRFLTPGRRPMSVEMTNCGELGWISEPSGYRYSTTDPDTSLPWPPMPEVLRKLARDAAFVAHYPDFEPEVCLINRYEPCTRLGLHRDQDEYDFTAPIVSVSLGVTATFLWGGLDRNDPPTRWELESGDVVVWGGPSRLIYHGIASIPVDVDPHPLTGTERINLTFRRVSAKPPGSTGATR